MSGSQFQPESDEGYFHALARRLIAPRLPAQTRVFETLQKTIIGAL